MIESREMQIPVFRPAYPGSPAEPVRQETVLLSRSDYRSGDRPRTGLPVIPLSGKTGWRSGSGSSAYGFEFR